MGRDIRQELINIQADLFIQPGLSNCSVTIDSDIIAVVGISVPDDYLVGRTITLSEIVQPLIPTPPPTTTSTTNQTETLLTEFTEVGTYTIINNTMDGSICNIRVSYTFTEKGEIECDIQDDTPIKNALQNVIDYVSAATSNPLISFKLPTRNDYFKQINILVEDFTNFINNYIHKEVVHTEIGEINTLIDKDPQDYKESTTLIQTYMDEVVSNVNNVENILVENQLYFDRLKTLMADVKIAEEKISNSDYIEYYKTRLPESKTKIDSLYNAFIDNGRDGYSDQIEIEQNAIKIQRS